jgi:hypothetical protein
MPAAAGTAVLLDFSQLQSWNLSMASQSVARSESIAAFVPGSNVSSRKRWVTAGVYGNAFTDAGNGTGNPLTKFLSRHT